MPMTSKQIIAHLQNHGFERVSQNGSHIKLRNPQTGAQVIIPYHSNELKKGLEHAILKQAGLI